jgi:hypothetical protein
MSDNLTFWSEEHLASLSVSRDFGKDLMTRAEISCSHLELLQIISNQPGLSGKTCPAFCHLTADEILVPSSGCWANSGMGSPTGFLTLNTSEWPKDAAVCSLSDTLETGDVPHKYYLSPRACQGILRRAEKCGKELPEQLRNALSLAVQTDAQDLSEI